jgi:hypothetical protein
MCRSPGDKGDQDAGGIGAPKSLLGCGLASCSIYLPRNSINIRIWFYSAGWTGLRGKLIHSWPIFVFIGSAERHHIQSAPFLVLSCSQPSPGPAPASTGRDRGTGAACAWGNRWWLIPMVPGPSPCLFILPILYNNPLPRPDSTLRENKDGIGIFAHPRYR